MEKQRLRRAREEADGENKVAEEDHTYQARQRDGRNPSFIQTETSLPREDDSATAPPEIDTEEMQPLVKPPNINGKNPFQQRPAFTSPSKGSAISNTNENIDSDEYSPISWQDQEEEGSFQANASSPSGSKFANPMRSAPSTATEIPNGSTSSENEEVPIERFNSSPSFVYNAPITMSDLDSSPQKPEADSVSKYDSSYFMNIPSNSDEKPQSFDYIQKWAENNQDLSKQTDEALDEPSVENGNSNSGTWYGSNEPPTTTSKPSTNTKPVSRKGTSYLDNYSKRDASVRPNRTNDAVSFSGGSSREQPSQQSSSSQSGTVYPDRIKAAYRDWCQYYGKEYNETRLRTFSSNFLAVEKYHRETGVSLILNELADMTSEEFKQNKN